MKPPYRLIWHYSEKPLLEFPPVYAGGRLYAVDNNGNAFALDADTGKMLWQRRVGRLNASSPAYHRNRLYIVNLVPGHIVKLDARTGKVLWKRSLPGRAESSPLVIGRSVYFGCEDGRLYALSTRNGNVRWSTQLGGPVKAAPAFRDGVLFVGDYGGHMNAVRAARRQAALAERLARARARRLGPVLLDRGARLRPRLRRQQRRPRLQLRPSRRHARLEPLDRRLRLLRPRRRQHRLDAADRLHRLLRRQRLRAQREERRNPLAAVGRRAGGRLALGRRQHRLRRRVHPHHDPRLRHAHRASGSSATRPAPTRR